MESNLYEVQFQLALIDYYLAQTYSDPKSAERMAALKKAAQAFDDIFQRNRGSVTGLYAHMWHGKTAEELGDLQTALDIYDEVLANAPEPDGTGAVDRLGAAVRPGRAIPLVDRRQAEAAAISARGHRLAEGLSSAAADGRLSGHRLGRGQGPAGPGQEGDRPGEGEAHGRGPANRHRRLQSPQRSSAGTLCPAARDS